MNFDVAWKNIRRSPYQALAAIFVFLQTMFVVSILAFVAVGSAKTISYLESLPQVSIFFKLEAKQQDIDVLKKQIEDTEKVSKIHFVSKKEALQIYRQQNKDDPLLLEFVTEQILPSSFNISTVDVRDLQTIVDKFKNSSIVDKVVSPKDIVPK